MKRLGILLLLLSASLSGYAAPSSDVHVGRYESIPWGFRTNTWWVEGPDGVVLIDTQFLPSAIAEAVEVAEEYTGKKVVLAFVLHANPDKFNGTGYLQRRGVRVLTSEQVRERIPQVDELRRSWFYDRYKPDYPERLALPDSLGDADTVVKAAGLEFRVHILGPSVSSDHIVVQVGDHVFVGDIIANRHHAWLELGHVDAWLKSLERIRALDPAHVYPGRGYAGGPALIDRQRDYLRAFVDVARSVRPSGDFDDEIKQQIVERMQSRYPDYGNEYFLNIGAEAVWRGVQNSLRGATGAD